MKKIIQLYKDEYIKKHKGTTSLSKEFGFYVYDQFKRLNLPLRNDYEKNKKYHCESNFFKQLDNEERAYWYGFILADGYITSSSKSSNKLGISLQEQDFNQLVKFNKAINGNYPINYYEESNGYKIGAKYCRICISDNVLVNDLISLGCVKRKSNIAKPPYNLNYSLRKHFIRGYLDANGSIAITKGKNGNIDSYSIKITGTNDILKWIMSHLISEKIILHEYPLYKRKKYHIVSTFDFGGNIQVLKFLDYIYQDSTVYLDRKYERYISLKQLRGNI